jgi:hypothetical protein
VTRHRRWLPEGLFSPIEYAARTPYRRPPGFHWRMQTIAPIVGKLGLTPHYVLEFELPGRRTGLPRRSLLVRVSHHGEHYLVALAGESEWVRNVRAAAGQVVLTHHNQRYDIVSRSGIPSGTPRRSAAWSGSLRGHQLTNRESRALPPQHCWATAAGSGQSMSRHDGKSEEVDSSVSTAARPLASSAASVSEAASVFA